MIRIFALMFGLGFSPADSVPLVSPNALLDSAKALVSHKNYDQAAGLLASISPDDTSYLEARANLMGVWNHLGAYDKSIEAGNEMKDTVSDFRDLILLNLGNAYLDSGIMDNAEKVYKEDLALYPYDYVVMYNLGVLHYRQKEYAESTEWLEKSARIDPYYANNHVLLGNLSVLYGNPAKALLSYMTYLMLEPDDNTVLVRMQSLVNNSLHDEATEPRPADDSLFENYDDLIGSKAAMDSRFKSDVAFNASIVNQAQLLMQQLRYVQGTKDFWMNYYVPIYTSIQKDGLTPAWIYFMLQSTDNKDVNKWISDHEGQKKSWIDIANKYLLSARSKFTAEVAGVKGEYTFLYYNSNALSSIGNNDANHVHVGPWCYFAENGQLTATGVFNSQGKKTGDWQYYYDNGVLSAEEHFDADGNSIGTNQYYYKNGARKSVEPHKDHVLDGIILNYYSCNQINERTPYVNGEQSGDGTIYFETGETKGTYHVEAGQLDGTYKTYYQIGKVETVSVYKAGKREGPYTSFYVDGSPDITTQLTNGQLSGPWKEQYQNGELASVGNFISDKRSGLWIDYHDNGIPSDSISYDNKGVKNGPVKHFDTRGRLVETEMFQNGVETTYVIYDGHGHMLNHGSNPSGNMEFKDYYPDGSVRESGSIRNGKFTGPDTTFYRNGNIHERGTFINKDYQGQYEEYAVTGQLIKTAVYDSGKLNGPYKQWFVNGNLEEEGNYVNDKREQAWRSYKPDGSLDKTEYFIDGDQNGWTTYYYNGPTHVKQRAYLYDRGTLGAIRQYDSLGNLYRQENMKFGNGIYALLTIKGDTLLRGLCQSGAFGTNIEYRYPNGKPEAVYTISNHLDEGPFSSYEADGTINTQGDFTSNDRTGTWKWFYDNGQVMDVRNYERGEREGEGVTYSETGQKIADMTYHNGDLVGPLHYYDFGGHLQTTKLYDDDGNLYAFISPQHPNDTILLKQKGSFEFDSFFADGSIAMKQAFRDGKVDGLLVRYNRNGTKMEEVHYAQGEYNGLMTDYYTDGKVREETPYRNDQINGIRREYFENGKLKRKTSFKNDVEDGLDIYYNLDGTMKSELLFKNDYEY